MTGSLAPAGVDAQAVEAKVLAMYRAVAEDPAGTYHFELGRGLAERLGYSRAALDRVPVGAVESFAGVGHLFDLLDLLAGEAVIDLGSGSGMDSFIAALAVGTTGRVTGVDITPQQLAKADRLRTEGGFGQVCFIAGRIEAIPLDAASVDAAMSNGVINLSAEKGRVFAEAARVLRPGGRLAVADIVTERQLPAETVCNADLWASCIGGAAQVDAYREAIAAAELVIEVERWNPYRFLSDQARNAGVTNGVGSLSILARKAR
jgi:SAM-dependent methyltransferase